VKPDERISTKPVNAFWTDALSKLSKAVDEILRGSVDSVVPDEQVPHLVIFENIVFR
jgi:hypothetical protein